MDFRRLADDECGQINSLTQLTSHLTQDRGFIDTHGEVFPSSSDQLVEQFLQESRTVPQSFRMDDLMREMHEIESQKLLVPPVPASAIKEQIQEDRAWAEQYIEDGRNFNIDTNAKDIWSQIASKEREILDTAFDGKEDYFELPDIIPNNDEATTQGLLNSDSKFVYSKFMNFMKNAEQGVDNLDSIGKLTEQEAQLWTEEFFQKENTSEEWTNEFVERQDNLESNFWNNIQDQLNQAQNLGSDEELSSDAWLSEYIENTNADYQFSEENPMIDINEPLERGKQFLDKGDFPSAVLCFEAAVQKEPENSEAWFYLGRTQAENEQDPNAIPALKKCLQLDPSNASALMALAVSYTNENYYNQALETLLIWLKNNEKYSDLVPPDFKLTGLKSKMVQDVFIKAAQRNPTNIDFEVQCGLGVLFNLSGDHDKAVDCFKTALTMQGDDARLWNRLGATLANGSRPEEAIEAYHHALSLSPGFIRARYNVGITCINLNAYKQAAEHFLIALNQQARGRDVTNSGKMSQMSETIWSTLRMCISLMNRSDLKPAVDARDLKSLNAAFEIADS